MYLAELTFTAIVKEKDEIANEINRFLSALRMNGQIIGREYPIVWNEESYQSYVLIAGKDSLEDDHSGVYVKKSLERLKKLKIGWRHRILGRDIESTDSCRCKKHTFFILYTNYVSIESPLRCGDCFSPVPLYRIQATKNGEYVDIISWESDYKACDMLQMNCQTGERFALSQLEKCTSSLAMRGRELCKKIEQVSGVPTYYYLMKSAGKSRKMEMERTCPSCGEKWLLKEKMHQLFDFRCDLCKLLSNIAWSIYR